MLKVQAVHKRYHKKTVLSDCSFNLGPYQIMGVFGHNGCGKSTLFRIIAGIIKADGGTVEVDRSTVAYMPEQRSLLVDLSVLKQALFMGKLAGMDEEGITLRIRDLARLFGFEDHLERPMKTLSKGNQQKAQLLLTLLKDPKILILDEPFNGLDYQSQKDLTQWIRSFAQQGKIVLISSHQLNHMNGLCDEILILDHGETIRQGSLQSFRDQTPLYSVKVNLDSNWKDFMMAYESMKVVDDQIEFRFGSLVTAKKAVNVLLKDRSVQSIGMEPVALSELVNA